MLKDRERSKDMLILFHKSFLSPSRQNGTKIRRGWKGGQS